YSSCENHIRGAFVFRRNGIFYFFPGESPDAPPALPTSCPDRTTSDSACHVPAFSPNRVNLFIAKRSRGAMMARPA
ncbi:hypothetical protein, partial [Brevundimonas sp.]|uniref:hypothetical protein n=1 Tax=Brevundimonas sp. TaxID=1871086 RepID=UPI0025C2A535